MREITVKADVDQHVMECLGMHYTELRARCRQDWQLGNMTRSWCDVFHDTFIYVAQDVEAKTKTEEELLEHFMYRFRLLKFQAMKEQQTEKVKLYADHKKANAETAAEKDI